MYLKFLLHNAHLSQLQLIAANDVAQLDKEIRIKKRTVRQLNDLSYELDTLRAQVEDKDLDVFDSRTVSLRKIILNLSNGYSGNKENIRNNVICWCFTEAELEKIASKVICVHQEVIQDVGNDNPFEGAQQIQIQANLDDLKLIEHESRLKNVQSIQENVEDLHGLYTQLHQMVEEQGERVDHVDDNVNVTHENVDLGLKQLVKAHK